MDTNILGRLTILFFLAGILLGCKSTVSVLDPNGSSMIESFESSSFDGSFVDYWKGQSLGQTGLATITVDLSKGSFEIILRQVHDDRTMSYDVYERQHRSEAITYRRFQRRFSELDGLSSVVDQVSKMIDSFGFSEELITGGGPITKNHLVLRTGKNVAVPFAGLASHYYESLENAAFSAAESETRVSSENGNTPLRFAIIEVLINQLDAAGE